MLNSQEKFIKAQEKLERALKNLEEVVTTKIDENSANSKLLNLEESDTSSLHAKTIEQEAIIKNLSEELNKTQNLVSEMANDKDFLKDKNRFFADKVFKFKSQGSKLIQAVEDDLTTIRNIIKNDQL